MFFDIYFLNSEALFGTLLYFFHLILKWTLVAAEMKVSGGKLEKMQGKVRGYLTLLRASFFRHFLSKKSQKSLASCS